MYTRILTLTALGLLLMGCSSSSPVAPGDTAGQPNDSNQLASDGDADLAPDLDGGAQADTLTADLSDGESQDTQTVPDTTMNSDGDPPDAAAPDIPDTPDDVAPDTPDDIGGTSDGAEDSAAEITPDVPQDILDDALPDILGDLASDVAPELPEDTNNDVAPEVTDSAEPDGSADALPNADAAPPSDIPTPICTEICGDVNQDGALDETDLSLLDATLGGGPPLDACGLHSADLKADETLSPADSTLLAAMLKGLVDQACQACAAACGDIDGDGALGVLDIQLLTDTILAGLPMDGCLFWRSDVNHDGVVNVGDVTTIIASINGLGDKVSCAP
jgi:hypothetical protein